MSKKLSLDSLTKKLRNVANTQDSIPMFSLWIIHHKVNFKLIIDTWLEILKTSKPKHRLTLWYLANDVIQSCHRKKADVFKDYFANVLPEAISFLRDEDILPGVERVLNVWSNRKIYDDELIDQLHAALLTNRPPDTLRQKLLAEYKPSMLVESLALFKKNEDTISMEEKQLKNIHIDASSSENIHKLKDKIGGELFSRNFEESATNIERFIIQYEKFVEDRKSLIDDLSQGAVFYRAQYHEAKIVVNAYQNFDARVSKMKKLLDQVKMKFPPKTPMLNPVQGHNEADMDMSDSDQELGSKPSKIVSVDTNPNRQITTRPVKTSTIPNKVSQPTQPTGTFVNRPGMRGASTSVSMFSSASPLKAASANINIPISFNGVTTSGFESKVSTPSGSPPSPEGSPELNISSPPRYPSLESRLADLFSGTTKVNIGSVAENTGSESDADSITNAPREGARRENQSTSDSAPDTKNAPQKTTKAPTSMDNQSSWQNTIPVIGGNRHSAPTQTRSFMENLHVVLDGGSTPLQDEANSEGENYQNREGAPSNGNKALAESQAMGNTVLPPPSFSGDALNFLTKFMGQQTNTSLAQPVQPPPTSEVPRKQTELLQNLNIDWSSLQNITASVGTWPPPPNTSTATPTTSQPHSKGATMLQVSREQDTDYRTSSKEVAATVSTRVHNTTNLATDPAATNQFVNILRRRSSEQTPNFAPLSEDVIVEEEEIVLEEDHHGEHSEEHKMKNTNNQVHLNNLKKIPTVNEALSPPPRPPSNNLLRIAGQKRHFNDTAMPRYPRTPDPIPRPPFPPRLGPPSGYHRPPSNAGNQRNFRGSFTARAPNSAEPYRTRPRRNSAPWPEVGTTLAEEEYYDMLYDELRPKYHRHIGRQGQFRPRRPYR